MKTCVCFYGLPQRSLGFTLQNIQKNVLFDNPDIYIHTFDTSVAQSIRGGEEPTTVDPRDILKLNPTKFRIDSEEDFNSSFNFKKYEDFGDPFYPDAGGVQTIHNLLRELHSIQQVWRMVENKQQYGRIIMTRADLVFSKPLDFECPPGTLLTCNRRVTPYHNDFLAMGTPESMEMWANRIDFAEDFCIWGAQPQVRLPHTGIHPETLVSYIVGRFNLKDKFIDVSPRRVRANGIIAD